MKTIEITFGLKENGPKLRFEVPEHRIEFGPKDQVVAFLTIEQVTEFMDTWVGADASFLRGWTFPDSEGDYNGVAIGQAGGRGVGVTMTVWDESIHGDRNEPLFSTFAFPYAITTKLAV